MRRTLALIAGTLCFLLVPSTAARAAYRFWDVSQTPGVSLGGSLACSRGPTTLVAWHEEPGEVRSRALVGGAWEAPVEHGPGVFPVLGWGNAGAVLAYASGTEIVIIEGNGTSWGSPLIISHDVEVAGLDVWCSPDEAPDLAYLVWETVAGEVRFARRTTGGWSQPEVVFQETTPLTWYEPQVCPSTGVGGFVPRVYFLHQAKVKYVQHDGASWTPPAIVSTIPSAGVDIDVAAGPDRRHRILSLAPQGG